jgi:hypothetical protein
MYVNIFGFNSTETMYYLFVKLFCNEWNNIFLVGILCNLNVNDFINRRFSTDVYSVMKIIK